VITTLRFAQVDDLSALQKAQELKYSPCYVNALTTTIQFTGLESGGK